MIVVAVRLGARAACAVERCDGRAHSMAMASDRQHLLAAGIEESMNLTRMPLTRGGGDVAGVEEELSTGQVRDQYPQRMPADGGPLKPVTHFPESGLFLEEPTISPDGRWLVHNRGKGGSSLWMLTLGTL